MGPSSETRQIMSVCTIRRARGVERSARTPLPHPAVSGALIEAGDTSGTFDGLPLSAWKVAISGSGAGRSVEAKMADS